MEEDLGEEALAFVRKKVHHIDEDELDAGPEVLCYGKRALFIWQKRPVYLAYIYIQTRIYLLMMNFLFPCFSFHQPVYICIYMYIYI